MVPAISPKKSATASLKTVPIEPGVPVYELTNTELQGRYRIEKEVFSDPYRNVVLQRVRFVPLQGKLSDYRVYALLAPHLANCGRENTGWVGDYKGTPTLFAHRDSCALAFACSVPWRKMSVGFAGTSDGWQDLSQNYQMTWNYTRAENGNVALTGEIDLARMQRGVYSGARLRRYLVGSRTGGSLQFA